MLIEGKEFLALSAFPTHALMVHRSGGVSSLLAPKLKGLGHEPSKSIHKEIKSAAAAAVKLLTRPRKRKHAIERVAKLLGMAGFRSRNGTPYSAGTIADWCKPRTRKTGGFEELYERWVVHFTAVRDRGKNNQLALGKTYTDDDLDFTILALLMSLPSSFSHSVGD